MSSIASLSPRETEVLTHLTRGSTNKEIAKALSIEPHTVASHVKAIFHKLDVYRRVRAAVIACKAGIE